MQGLHVLLAPILQQKAPTGLLLLPSSGGADRTNAVEVLHTSIAESR